MCEKNHSRKNDRVCEKHQSSADGIGVTKMALEGKAVLVVN
jgi:hypothetical protein